MTDGFDFIQGLVLGFHLNKVKISSLLCYDFIKQTETERTIRLLTDLFSLSACYMGLGLAHLRLTSQMRCSHFAQSVKFSAKDITL